MQQNYSSFTQFSHYLRIQFITKTIVLLLLLFYFFSINKSIIIIFLQSVYNILKLFNINTNNSKTTFLSSQLNRIVNNVIIFFSVFYNFTKKYFISFYFFLLKQDLNNTYHSQFKLFCIEYYFMQSSKVFFLNKLNVIIYYYINVNYNFILFKLKCSK